MEVFDNGKIIEIFNYMDEYNFENTYIGYLIQIEDTVYQVIATQHNLLLNPEEEAIVFTTQLNDMYSDIKKSMQEPIKIETKLVDENEFDKKSDIEVDDYVIKYKGKVIAKRFTNETIFDQYKELDSWNEDNQSTNNTNDNNGNIVNNITNFNTPW